jgi:ferredoxin-NADP reductase
MSTQVAPHRVARMLDRALAPLNRWALDHIDHHWIDYVISNTMTDFNRWWNGFLWTYELKAQVLRVHDEAPGVKTFILRPNQHWRGMKAGQFVEVIAEIDGQPQRRFYSATTLPGGRVSITVKATPQGLVSGWLHTQLKPGMQIGLGRPQGHFRLNEGTGAGAHTSKMLFLCAGSGITPCHAIVHDMLTRPADQRPDIQVMAQFRSEADVIFKPALQQTWPQAGIQVNLALSAAGTRLNRQQLQQHCPDLLAREIFLCGPAGFMAAMLTELQAMGVDVAKVHTERFTAAPALAASQPDFSVDGAEVYFQHLDHTITLTAADQGKTLLELAQCHGVDVEAGCGQGMCGTCRLTLHEGQVSGNVLGKVVYLCTAFPAGERVVLDA